MITNRVDEIISALKLGNVAGIPTETVYGLAAPIDNESALKLIFEIKQRPFFDPLIVHIAGLDQLADLALDQPEWLNSFTEHLWPGPLSIVLKKAPRVSSLITAGHPTVAVRMPRHKIARQIIEGVGVPLAAPSANMFGHTSPTTAAHVESEFNGKVLVFDGGAAEVGIESTVIDLTEQRKIKILRPGAVTRDDLIRRADQLKLNLDIESAQQQNSPGTLPHHYQPRTPLILIDHELISNTGTAADVIGRSTEFKSVVLLELKLGSDPIAAARLLYAELRRLDEQRPGAIYFIYDSAKQFGAWEAIWDRLSRAASVRLAL